MLACLSQPLGNYGRQLIVCNRPTEMDAVGLTLQSVPKDVLYKKRASYFQVQNLSDVRVSATGSCRITVEPGHVYILLTVYF